jgi:hypothetical protein
VGEDEAGESEEQIDAEPADSKEVVHYWNQQTDRGKYRLIVIQHDPGRGYGPYSG